MGSASSSPPVGSIGVAIVTALLIASMGTGAIAFGSGEANAQAGFSAGSVDLDVFVADNTFTPGSTEELTLQVANDGEIRDGSSPETTETTTTARNVRVEVDEKRAPISVETGKTSIGSLGTEEPRDVPIEIDVPENAEPGTYEIEVELEYRQTRRIFTRGGIQGDRSRTVTRDVDIVIDDAARFELRELETSAQVADSGPLTAEIENVGGERATDITVELTSASQRVTFGESGSESASLAGLDPGETATIEYDLTFGERASLREYPLEATVSFEDPNGIPGTDARPMLDVTPVAKQTFAIDGIESTLRVGEDGDLYGTVTNTSPVTASSVVVRYDDEYPNIVPIERDVAVGTVEPGESADFRLPIELSREAEAVPKSVDMAVTYRNEDNELRQFDDVDAFVEVAEQRDEFLIDVDDRTVEAGSSTRIDIRVTNNLDQTVTDVEAKLFTDSPLSSGGDDEGYVETLAPDESVTITFEIAADAGTTPRTYPLQMDFRYDDERDNSKVSDTYRTAIDVTEATDEGLPWVPIAGVVLLVVGAAALLYRRRTGA